MICYRPTTKMIVGCGRCHLSFPHHHVAAVAAVFDHLILQHFKPDRQYIASDMTPVAIIR